MENKEKIKKQIVEFAVNGVETFLQENPDLEFYAFAFDCNAEYASFGLCFNTEDDFKNTLEDYQAGDSSKYYQTEDDIKGLKYNTGDWEYQCFENLDIFSEEELKDIFNEMSDEDYQASTFENELLELLTESLVEFSKTETFKKIPKTKDFIFFCIDHDEDFDEAIDRLKHFSVN